MIFKTVETTRKELPQYLQDLIKLTGKRPNKVEVRLSSGMEMHTVYNQVWSFGCVVSEHKESRMDSGGEWVTHTTEIYSAPTVMLFKNRHGSYAVITLFGVSENVNTIEEALQCSFVAGDGVLEQMSAAVKACE